MPYVPTFRMKCKHSNIHSPGTHLRSLFGRLRSQTAFTLSSLHGDPVLLSRVQEGRPEDPQAFLQRQIPRLSHRDGESRLHSTVSIVDSLLTVCEAYATYGLHRAGDDSSQVEFLRSQEIRRLRTEWRCTTHLLKRLRIDPKQW